MIAGVGLGGLLALAATQLPETLPTDPPQAARSQRHFAPPLGRPMRYRVATRRLARDGAFIGFTLVYALEWQRAGRGFQLAATLQRIESDADPAVVRAVTTALRPLVGEPMTYFVAPDGRRVELLDPEGLWQRAAARTQALGAGAQPAEAQQMARLLGALPPAERERLATADIRALIVPANAAIPAGGADATIHSVGGLRMIVKTGQDVLPEEAGAGRQTLHLETRWTIDTATGLLVHERQQSWIVAPDSGARTLVEERVRDLQSG